MAGGVEWLVFFDTESTGLPEPGHKPRITELCLLAVSVRAVRDNYRQFQQYCRLPRVLHKLTLCLDPAQPLRHHISDITGLYNDELGEVKGLSADTVALLSGFFQQLKGSACLVAHNGNRFDFPLLAAEMKRVGAAPLPSDLMVADTLPAFRAWHTENIYGKAVLESSRTPDLSTRCDSPPRRLHKTRSLTSSDETPKPGGSLQRSTSDETGRVKRKLDFPTVEAGDNSEPKYQRGEGVDVNLGKDKVSCDKTKVACEDKVLGDRKSSATSMEKDGLEVLPDLHCEHQSRNGAGPNQIDNNSSESLPDIESSPNETVVYSLSSNFGDSCPEFEDSIPVEVLDRLEKEALEKLDEAKSSDSQPSANHSEVSKPETKGNIVESQKGSPETGLPVKTGSDKKNTSNLSEGASDLDFGESIPGYLMDRLENEAWEQLNDGCSPEKGERGESSKAVSNIEANGSVSKELNQNMVKGTRGKGVPQPTFINGEKCSKAEANGSKSVCKNRNLGSLEPDSPSQSPSEIGSCVKAPVKESQLSNGNRDAVTTSGKSSNRTVSKALNTESQNIQASDFVTVSRNEDPKSAPNTDSKAKTAPSSDSKSTPANKVSQQQNTSSGSLKLPSCKLSELHVRLLGHPFSGAHGAEADTMALLRCTLAAGPRFLELLIDSSSRFSEVAPMH